MTAEELLSRAEAAAANAYAPYSDDLVGASVPTRGGDVYDGVNVENAAYPLGICAGRTALARAASEGVRPGQVAASAITATPCGGCRRWLHEWRVERVWSRRGDGSLADSSPAELLFDTWQLS